MFDKVFRKIAVMELTHMSVFDKICAIQTDRHWKNIGAIHKLENGREVVDIVTVTADNLKTKYGILVACGAAAILGNVCSKMKH